MGGIITKRRKLSKKLTTPSGAGLEKGTIYLRGLPGPAGLPGAVLVLADAGVVGAVVVVAGLVGVAAAPLPVPLAGVAPPEVPIGVDAGAAGSEVSGVGSGGSGFDRMLATNSFIPVSELLRNLYHWVRLSVHAVFWAASLESVPASATARA